MGPCDVMKKSKFNKKSEEKAWNKSVDKSLLKKGNCGTATDGGLLFPQHMSKLLDRSRMVDHWDLQTWGYQKL